jgi:CheY-like chemotaxis protein
MTKDSNKYILFADDDRLLRMLVEESLTEFGYRVLVASNGEEAINIYEQHINSIFIVILDIVMPKIDGLCAASRMRSLNRGLPIIFITGKNREDYSNIISEIENYYILEKPFSLENIDEVIRKAFI